MLRSTPNLTTTWRSSKVKEWWSSSISKRKIKSSNSSTLRFSSFKANCRRKRRPSSSYNPRPTPSARTKRARSISFFWNKRSNSWPPKMNACWVFTRRPNRACCRILKTRAGRSTWKSSRISRDSSNRGKTWRKSQAIIRTFPSSASWTSFRPN